MQWLSTAVVVIMQLLGIATISPMTSKDTEIKLNVIQYHYFLYLLIVLLDTSMFMFLGGLKLILVIALEIRQSILKYSILYTYCHRKVM